MPIINPKLNKLFSDDGLVFLEEEFNSKWCGIISLAYMPERRTLIRYFLYEDVCMQIWSSAQTVLGLDAYGPQKCFNFFLPFTLSYRLPEPSIQLSNFHTGHIFQVDYPQLEVNPYVIMHFSIEYCNTCQNFQKENHKPLP